MNRSSGAYTREIWRAFAIIIKLDDGSYLETVKTAPSRKMALGMAFDRQSGTVMMCKTADQLTADERGRYDMQTAADKIADARENQRRSVEFHHFADMN